MAIADQIDLQLADEKGQHAMANPASSIAAGITSGNAMRENFQARNKEEAAEQFQLVLNQGYKAMQQAFKSADSETQLLAGDPSLYQSNEDTMAAWWAKFASAQDKVQKKQATQKAVQLETEGQSIEAQKTLAGVGAVSPETALEGTAKAKEREEFTARGKKIQEIISKYKGGTSTVAGSTGDLSDPKSQFARQFKITSKRVETLAPHIEKAVADSGVPANLVKAIISVESAGKPNQKSSAGAEGFMQMIPSTAKAMGVIDVHDPEQNIVGGTKYIGQLLQQFGDLEKAIAAYNAGPTTVNNLVKKYGDKWKEYLPEETKDYIESVPKYLKAYGGGSFATEGNTPSAFGLYKEGVAADANLATDPRFKAGIDAIDKDAENARLRRSDVAAERERALQGERLQKRVNNLRKLVESKHDVMDVMKDLDETMPGGIYGKDPIPGIGIGENAVRKWMFSTSDKNSSVGKLKINLARLANTTIKDVTGLVMTNQEAGRIMQELGLSATSTESDLRYALQQRIEDMKKDYIRTLQSDNDAMADLIRQSPEFDPEVAFGMKKQGNKDVTTKTGKKIKVTVKKTE